MTVDVFGIGNYTEVIIELIIECGHEIGGLYHYESERIDETVMGYKILGDYNYYLNNKRKGNVVVAIGNNKIRSDQLDRLSKFGFNTPSLIHPRAYVSKSAKIGSAVYIHANSFVWTKAKIGDHSIISPNAMIAHHTKIGKGTLISANATIGSYVIVGNHSMIGINSGIISKRIEIGDDVVVGGQAFVISNIPSNTTYVGIPAKDITKINKKV